MSPESDSPAAVLPRLSEALKRLGITDFALTGGLALGAWTTPRYTRDLDLCAVVPLAAVDPLLARYDGVRTGPEPLPHIVRFSFGDFDVDLFAAHNAYDLKCLARAVPVEIGGNPIRVVTAEDLIIHKLIKLKDDRRKLLQDASDLRALVAARGAQLDRPHLRHFLAADDARLIDELPSIDDSALVQRLLAR